jgi:hypothetical protein
MVCGDLRQRATGVEWRGLNAPIPSSPTSLLQPYAGSAPSWAGTHSHGGSYCRLALGLRLDTSRGWAILGGAPLRGGHDLPKGRDPGRGRTILHLYHHVHPAGSSKTGLGRFSAWEEEGDDLQPFLVSARGASQETGALQASEGGCVSTSQPKAKNPSPMRAVHGVDDPEGGSLRLIRHLCLIPER